MMGMRTANTLIASVALGLAAGISGAPAAFADRPDTAPETATRIEACPWITMDKGEQRWQVAFVQYLLRDYGYYSGTITDTFGRDAEGAVERYQQDKDLSEDGTVGPETWEHLRFDFGQVGRSYTPQPADRIRGVQYALDTAYGNALSIDGYFGPGTETGVWNFQSDIGVGADGIVGPLTFRALATGCV